MDHVGLAQTSTHVYSKSFIPDTLYIIDRAGRHENSKLHLTAQSRRQYRSKEFPQWCSVHASISTPYVVAQSYLVVVGWAALKRALLLFGRQHQHDRHSSSWMAKSKAAVVFDCQLHRIANKVVLRLAR